VPPFTAIKVPDKVILPVVAAAGVNPVVPAEKLKTPVFVIVTLPVGLDTEIPEPAILDKTPVLATVIGVFAAEIKKDVPLQVF